MNDLLEPSWPRSRTTRSLVFAGPPCRPLSCRESRLDGRNCGPFIELVDLGVGVIERTPATKFSCRGFVILIEPVSPRTSIVSALRFQHE
jgi:hypothetical protein